MVFYLKVWPDETATLMTQMGQILWTFPTVEEALAVCREWYGSHEVRIEYEMSQTSDLDGTVSYEYER